MSRFGGGYGGIFLGGGDIAGIVVGCFFGACLIAAVLWWFIGRPIMNKRRAKHGGQPNGGKPWPSFYDGRKSWAVKGRQWPSVYDRQRPDRTTDVESGGGGFQQESKVEQPPPAYGTPEVQRTGGNYTPYYGTQN